MGRDTKDRGPMATNERGRDISGTNVQDRDMKDSPR